MELNPEYIHKNLGKLGKQEAFRLLKGWIENSQDFKSRRKSLKLIGTIDDGTHFSFLEQLFLSDKDIPVSIIAGKILKKKYSTHPGFLPLLQYCLNQPMPIDITLFSMRALREMGSFQARKILTECLEKLINSIESHHSSQLPQFLAISSFGEQIGDKTFEIWVNLALYKHYTKNCGYNVTMREGLIILLNCDGAGLDSVNQIPKIHELHHLRYLSLKRNNLSSLARISSLQNLTKLDASHNQLEKISHLEKQTELKELNLSHNRIESIANLANQQVLEKLDLSYNKISHIQNINHLKCLKYLNLSNNQIREITQLHGLAHLKKLNLSYNQIKKLENIWGLPNLIWFYVNDNQIEKIEGLNELKELRGLLLSHNNIKSIEGLTELENLRKLELSENQITKIEGLGHNKALQELYLDKNEIKSLEGLEALESLIILFLEQNEIREFDHSKIESLKTLDRFFLNDNPLTEESLHAYRNFKSYW
ncbi:MAG: leucine-rich repeat domain-containing protein [Promethearchaeia archaeon]